MRIIFHIDMNAFYANCEISQHPELRGKPIVICHNSKRSVVSTASYEDNLVLVLRCLYLWLKRNVLI